jgi:threonine dehydrogenase-like Zn-dependent dehydrogenase
VPSTIRPGGLVVATVRRPRLEETGVLLEPMTVAQKGVFQAYEIQRRLRVWEPRRAAVLGSGTIGLLATLALRLRGLEVTCFLEAAGRTSTAT